MFNYDAAMADPEYRGFTNVSFVPESDQEEQVINEDDFQQTVDIYDTVMKVVFKKSELVETPHIGGNEKRLVTVQFAKYVLLENYEELLDDIGWEFHFASTPMKGQEYITLKMEGMLEHE
ncbi:hypothetical protein NRIC_03630 [Enterococcus florum]|uniref:Uncharacterized protein n=1 Tax=Enterococcus florum TaxID=2480627 RepID=A0A4P5PAE6_9ENTE|nr:hypothetical protein [Enterococcus florum]GCF92472.1 hypothetical protein NRIC_03630 [Enterococcus florum]